MAKIKTATETKPIETRPTPAEETRLVAPPAEETKCEPCPDGEGDCKGGDKCDPEAGGGIEPHPGTLPEKASAVAPGDHDLALYPTTLGDSASILLGVVTGGRELDACAGRALWHLEGYVLGIALPDDHAVAAGAPRRKAAALQPLDHATMVDHLERLAAVPDHKCQAMAGADASFNYEALVLALLPLIRQFFEWRNSKK